MLNSTSIFFDNLHSKQVFLVQLNMECRGCMIGDIEDGNLLEKEGFYGKQQT